MRRICVTIGPSLLAALRPHDPMFEWLPPAAAGDVAALLNDPPDILCLIDGLFDSRPAPWHKELMMLMSAGTIVLGASSMGALRAAELDRHGMIGVGAIYAAYRDGCLTGDDEVALIHATAQLDWAPLSVPMVEVRATLVAACRQGVIGVAQAGALREAAAALHFTDRDWPALRTRWTRERLCGEAAAEALTRLHVPLKRQDALACLEVASRVPATPAPPPPPITYFVQQLLRPREA